MLVATISPSGAPPPPKRLQNDLEHSETSSAEKQLGQLWPSCHICENSFGEEVKQQQLSPEELHIVHCDCSASADALLARWWKMAASRKCSEGHVSSCRTGLAEKEERIMSMIKSNAGLQSQLYHIAR